MYFFVTGQRSFVGEYHATKITRKVVVLYGSVFSEQVILQFRHFEFFDLGDHFLLKVTDSTHHGVFLRQKDLEFGIDAIQRFFVNGEPFFFVDIEVTQFQRQVINDVDTGFDFIGVVFDGMNVHQNVAIVDFDLVIALVDNA